MLKRSSFIVVLLCNVMLFTGALALSIFLGAKLAHSACSPGIPCTDYDLYSAPFAGQTVGLNGPKTGKDSLDYSERTCDGNFMNQIYSKAYMEGRRQVIMSEQIIHKPDSVLEYTCFDGYVAHAAINAAPIFSETTHWQNHNQVRETADEIITDTYNVDRVSIDDNCGGISNDVCVNNLADALQYLVNDVMSIYIQNNFSHTYMGEALSIDYIPGGVAGCADMSTVWSIAKCLDFSEDDQFRTFQSLIDADPRSIPQECSPGHSFHDNADADDDDIEAGGVSKLDNTGPSNFSDDMSELCPPVGAPVAGVNTGFSNDLLRVSNNCPDPADDDNKHAYAEIDLIELKDYLLLGAGDGSGFYIPGTGGDTDGLVLCAAPIPTGIPVITVEHDWEDRVMFNGFLIGDRDRYVHYEYICPNPGCFYRPIKMPLPEIIGVTIPNFDTFVSAVGVGLCIRY